MSRRTIAADPSASPAERLLLAIFSNTAGFDGAACRGESDLFDPRDHDRDETADQARDRHEDAARICRTCPVLARCRDWATGEPEHGSVVGGAVPTTARDAA